MALFRKAGSPYWWYDVRIDGTRHRGSTKQQALGKARTHESLLITQLSTGAGIIKPVVLRDFVPTFRAFVQANRDLAEKTKVYYENGWRLLSSQPIAGMKMGSITPADAAVISVPGSGSNINCALRTLRRILSLAEEKQLIAKVPRIALAEENERKAVVKVAVDLQYTTAPRTVRDVYLLVSDCGIRPADASAIGWEDVDFTRGDIFIRGGKTGRKAERYVPMTSRVREMLIARASLDTQWVFASKRKPGHPIRPSSFSTRAAAFKRTAGIPKEVVLYSARHTFATDLTEATGNLVKTQKALGHTSLSTTARYNHSRSADVATIMDARNAQRQQEVWSELRPQ